MAAEVVVSLGALPGFDGVQIRAGSATDRGQLREANEDSCGVFLKAPGSEFPLDGVLIAADGVGGHEGGAVASRFVVDSVIDTIRSHGRIDRLSAWFTSLLESIHRELLREASERGMADAMGSTATVAALDGRVLVLAHVGDSRAYRLRNGHLEQLTDDDSWVARQERAGIEVSPDDPQKNVLTQCLGIGASLEVHTYVHPLSRGDRFLLCSDGLHGVIDDDEIADILRTMASPEACSERLIEAANAGGGPDNITAVVFDVGAPAPVSSFSATPPSLPTASPPTPSPPLPIPARGGGAGSWLVGAGLVVLTAASLTAGLGLGPQSVSPTPSPPLPDSTSGPLSKEQNDVGSRQDTTHPQSGTREDRANGPGPSDSVPGGRPDAEDDRNESSPGDRSVGLDGF